MLSFQIPQQMEFLRENKTNNLHDYFFLDNMYFSLKIYTIKTIIHRKIK